MSTSHPSIRFEQIPIVEGPLTHFNDVRSDVIREVKEHSSRDLATLPNEMLLGEALYQEKLRLKRDRGNIFTKSRLKNDRELWGKIRAGLLQPSAIVDRQALMDQVLHHYADEIGGRFSPKTYWSATRLVPFFFSWLLNAASVQRFRPWGMTESLSSRLNIVGEVPLIQKLSKQGTILLVPTHQSNIDSVLIGYIIYLMSLPPFAYGAGLNLFSNPLLSFFMSGLGAYTVDRRKTNQIYKQVLKNYSSTILRRGVHSIFFPGGGRSRSGAIESKLKLGLLGTALDAQLSHLQRGDKNHKVFIFPMVTSYHFVLEAASLIEDFLSESGKHQFIYRGDESWEPTKVLRFFWRLFSSTSGVSVRLGRPLDVFGNFVDDDGVSLGPNGTTIDPVKWFTTCGEVKADAQRDQIYTRQLGERLVERYYRENTVLTSHAVAFALFETLRKQYPDLDLYRFVRISLAQRSLALDTFMAEASLLQVRLRQMADSGKLYLSRELQTQDTRAWVEDGIQQLGLLHDAKVVGVQDQAIFTEDMNLLYYYRNRLSGYGLSVLSQVERGVGRGNDKKGFLA